VSARARSVLGVAIMSALLVLYFVFAGIRAVALLASREPIPVIMGAAMLILPLLGVWALVRELQFGRSATRLADRLAAEGRMPEEPVATHPSGRPVREDADAEADPESWQAWMRLGIVYDACGDRRRARGAIRQAISLERDEIRGASAQS
jgi:cytochrome c-type biogenesis protein CcmH/NrfG